MCPYRPIRPNLGISVCSSAAAHNSCSMMLNIMTVGRQLSKSAMWVSVLALTYLPVPFLIPHQLPRLGGLVLPQYLGLVFSEADFVGQER